jgi:hypothetical protein
MNAETMRLEEIRTRNAPWNKWGPYLTERQWGTVREDYSPDGNAWEYISHDAARSKAFRWGEEGIAGISDAGQILCFSLALWNGRDPILKERFFGLTGREGNHGEDVKEYYYYLDNTPTHSYMKMLYKYPQSEFPYTKLVEENRRRNRSEPEYELIDTGIFAKDRYFDVFVEYGKSSPEDLLIRITAVNRGPEECPLHILPHLWFRNRWSWGPGPVKPVLYADTEYNIRAESTELGPRWLYCEGFPELLFCENETNARRLYGCESEGFFKDGINDCVVHGAKKAVNPSRAGTRAAAHYRLSIPAGGSETIRLRLTDRPAADPFAGFDDVLALRIREADAFYAEIQRPLEDEDAKNVQRQAFAGMLWTKQFYFYDVPRWLKGDPGLPPPPEERLRGRNAGWTHLNNADIISMPDKWEFPWYAAWDLAFHCIPLSLIDPDFAKEQFVLLTREWYMHPNGQVPAYEWSFGDVNPPVHAWAAWRVYKIDRKQRGGNGDFAFLERVFHKLLLNFTWWVNREDADGRNIFQGGFLGLDNVSVFDRSRTLPGGAHLEQTDGTAWMAMYCLNMMRIALELALRNPVYEDLATKFFEHFLYIAGAMTNIAGEKVSLWDEEDEFFYDALHLPNDEMIRLKVRSVVGLTPLLAVEVLEPALLEKLPDFRRRLEWFLRYRPDLASLVSRWHEPGVGERRLLSLLRGHRMKRLLKRMLDEKEFLSPCGVRSLSRFHGENPYVFRCSGMELTVRYQPAESDSPVYGGNSNWRGPVWFPLNFLLIESLQKFHHYYGDDFKIECPTGSGVPMTIRDVADELTRRLVSIFLRDRGHGRPVFGSTEKFQTDPHFRDYILFHEYFHGESGRGLGASHQTGWTGLAAKLLQPRQRD